MKLHININADSLIKHHSLPVSVTTSEDTKQILNSTSNRQTNIHQHEILRKYIFLISSFLSRFQIKNYFIEKPEPTDYNINVIPKTHLITILFLLLQVAFVATLACACATPSYYAAPYAAPYAGRFANDPPAPITVLPSGFLADTPDVATAKAAHLAEKAKVASYPYGLGPYVAPYVAPYAGPYAGAYAYGPAQITVLPSGYLADTPEVAASKVAHEAAKASAAAAAAASPDYTSYYPFYYGHHY